MGFCKYTWALPILMALMTLGCSNSMDDADSYRSQWQFSDRIDLTGYDRDVIDGMDEFSHNLMVTASKVSESRDFCISPVSVSVFLGMLANATEGECREQILSALGQNGIADLNSTCNKLMRFLPCESNGSCLAVANRFWVADRHSVPAEFRNTIGVTFNAGVDLVDFHKSSTVPAINRWVSDNTFGKIPVILDGDWSSYADTQMICANTVYFKGNWSHKFNKDNTRPGLFRTPQGDKEVDMMHGDMPLYHYSDDYMSAVSLYFDGDANVMTLYLPKKSVEVSDLVAMLTPEVQTGIRNAMEMCKVSLSMPTFIYDSKSEIQEILDDLGITALRNADLSPMNIGDTFIRTLHRTSIKVDEDGAELAAVTASVGEIANMMPELRKINVDFDRPFLYMIRNSATGAILMAGVVTDPS